MCRKCAFLLKFGFSLNIFVDDCPWKVCTLILVFQGVISKIFSVIFQYYALFSRFSSKKSDYWENFMKKIDFQNFAKTRFSKFDNLGLETKLTLFRGSISHERWFFLDFMAMNGLPKSYFGPNREKLFSQTTVHINVWDLDELWRILETTSVAKVILTYTTMLYSFSE